MSIEDAEKYVEWLSDYKVEIMDMEQYKFMLIMSTICQQKIKMFGDKT